MQMSKTGNVLGEATAEADDRMLSEAFVETRNFRELVSGSDWRFVVGRRGAGKSALFKKVAETLAANHGTALITERPSEEKILALQDELSSLTTKYLEARPVSRLLWKVQILTEAFKPLQEHYKAKKLVVEMRELNEMLAKHAELLKHSGLARSLAALREVRAKYPNAPLKSLPEKIAEHFEIGRLEALITSSFQKTGQRLVFLYDGLDEGWMPEPVSTSILGGLSKAAAEFREASTGIHCILFIRDNMARSLAQIDPDYSRNIEVSTLRLQWDEASLLDLVARRLRAAFGWGGEQDIKAWNRFAQKGLGGRDGFRKCLKLTLYRPRDVIALLNGAWQAAGRANRDAVVDEDVESFAHEVSRTRLSDLLREYEGVLPSLRVLVDCFRAGPARSTYSEATALLQARIDEGGSGAAQQDLGLIGSGASALNLLFSVGFLGLQGADGAGVLFCHDGSDTNALAVEGSRRVLIHPAYWKSLAVHELDEADTGEVLIRVDDSEDLIRKARPKEEVQETKLSKLGQVADELSSIQPGREHASRFEAWVLSTVRFLFGTQLENLQHHPNPNAIQQRDIVGRIATQHGFFSRLERDYNVRQLVIEVKNYENVAQDEFRQAWGYLSQAYGKCLLMVTRARADSGVSATERMLIKEGMDKQGKLVLVVPAELLQRALRKARSPATRLLYAEDKLGSKLDQYERSFVDTTRR